MHGKIIKGIAGFYYVQTEEGIIECKAKGIFRNKKVKPLVGDNVEIEIIDAETQKGNIIQILKRNNQLIRPAVANVDQAVVIFASSYPKPNLNLLDRFLLMMETQHIPCIICFNKIDDGEKKEIDILVRNYQHSGCKISLTSTITGEGMNEFKQMLMGKTSVLAGPSGVGKSSVMNAIFQETKMETGDISDKIKRGKHTTRHSELFFMGKDTYIMDTPGFTSLGLPKLEKEELKEYYPEFLEYRDSCRFLGCVHICEPDCGVKKALSEGTISQQRYENYKQFFEEINTRKKY